MANRVSSVKRQKLSNNQQQQQQQQPLLPGLPDHVAQLCLSHLHPSLLYSVCLSWRRLIYSPSFPPFLSLYALFSSSSSNSNLIHFFSFDPISSDWESLPPPPPDPPLRLLLRHPSFISRSFPVQSISVSGNLVLLAATTHNFFPAFSRPLIFNPISCSWAFGPPLAVPRRWCAAGTSSGVVYVASGIGSHFSSDVARSVERWVVHKTATKKKNHESAWKWEKIRGLKDGRFSRDAIDAVGWRGKLCMVNVKGDAAKEGVVYNIRSDSWEKMPEGMVAGWKGPVATMDEEKMFVVDESRGALRRYDEDGDDWVEIMKSESLKGAQQIVAGGGRVCAVTVDGRILTVDLTVNPARVWEVESPPGLEAVAVHILPRMSRNLEYGL